MKKYETIPLTEEAHIGHARRIIRRRATDMQFGEQRIAEIDIAVKEIGSNAVKFARGTGRIFVAETTARLEHAGLELIYADKGPGIPDTALAISDGFTTTGTLGAGLGAIKRMMDEFYIYSTIASQTRRLPLYGRTTHGTVIVIRKHLPVDGELSARKQSLWGAFSRPVDGAEDNGDSYIINRKGDRQILAVIDGLGHGAGAKEASTEAVAVIDRQALQPVETIIQTTHEALRETRGAVLGLAAIDRATGVVEYAGIGNTDFRVYGGPRPLRFISLNGTLGSRLNRIKVFKEQLPRVATIVMTTDGISENWDPENYPGLLGLHPQLICSVVMRDFNRPKDDATILCGRLSF